MPNEYGSATPYTGATLDQIHESIGIPQFTGASGETWYFVFNGIIFQGGILEVPIGGDTFNFPAPFTLQVLGVFLQPMANHEFSVSATTLDTFTISHTGTLHNCYWFAIGV